MAVILFYTLDLVQTNIAEIFNQAKKANVETRIAVVGRPTAGGDTKNGQEENNEAEVSWFRLMEDLEKALKAADDNEDTKFDSNRVAEDIHGLADTLPVAGFHLDVIWPVTAETVCPIEENLALFGALQRLKTWHNAHLTIAMVQDGYSWSMDTWLTYLKGEVKQLAKDCGNLLDWDLVWRGDLRFRDGKGVSVVPLPGFNLIKSSDDDLLLTVEEEQAELSTSQDSVFYEDNAFKQLTAFDRSLDVIHIVKLEDVPSCLVSSHKFIVKITPGDILPRTSAIYTWLFSEAKDDSMALLVRLRGTNALESALNGTSDEEQLKTIDWKKHMYQVPSIDVKGHPFAFHMLIHGDREGQCVARVMHLPHQMNAEIHVDLAQSKVLFGADDESDGSFQSVPLFDGDKLVEEGEDLDALQKKAIREFVELRLAEDKNATVTIAEIKHLISKVRREYLSEMKTRKSLKKIDLLQDVPEVNLKSVLTEFDQSPSEWLERLYLHQKESVEKKMKRYKSSDMMLAGMMVKKCKDNTIQLNAEEFLKHFTSDGHSAAIEEALSPIGVTAGSVAKSKHKKEYSEDTLKEKQPFEELVKHKHPGIGYCLDLIKAQKEENHLVKMQQKLVWNETASTCTMEQAASPATMEIRSSKGEVKGQPKRKLSESGKKRVMRGVKRKGDDAESSQANKRRLLRGDTVEETFVKPSSTHQRITKKAHSLDSKTTSAIRSSPRRKQSVGKTVSIQRPQDVRRRASTSMVSSSKVTTTTIGAAGQRSSRSISVSGSRSGGSRKQKHTEILQGIVDELLKSKDIQKENPIYLQCSKRLFNTTKEYVRALPPNSYPSLRTEMKNIATQNLDFVVSFEERLHAAKEKK